MALFNKRFKKAYFDRKSGNVSHVEYFCGSKTWNPFFSRLSKHAPGTSIYANDNILRAKIHKHLIKIYSKVYQMTAPIQTQKNGTHVTSSITHRIYMHDNASLLLLLWP